MKNCTSAFLAIILTSLFLHQSLHAVPSEHNIKNMEAPITHAEIGKLLLDHIEARNKATTHDAAVPTAPNTEHANLQKLYEIFAAEKPIYNETPLENKEKRILMQDLELLQRRDHDLSKPVLFSCLDRTRTSFGRAALVAMLIRSTAATPESQKAIRILADDEFLMKGLSTLLDQVKKTERDLLSGWNSTDIDAMYFLGLKNRLVLQLSSRISELTPLFSVINAASYICKFASTRANLFGYLVLNGIPLGVQLQSDVKKAQSTKNLVRDIQKNLRGMADFISATHIIQNTIDENPALNLYMSSRHGQTHTRVKSKEHLHLLKLLNRNTFKTDLSFSSSRGDILESHQLMQKCKHEFIDHMKAIGELDALLSLATLIRESKNKKLGYSFVNYVESDTPFLDIKKFWNPHIDPDKAVPNDITLSGDQNTIILTGANSGGKSTALKAILTAALLTKTTGIAPAESVTVTAPLEIRSSLKVVDSIGKASQYQAEADRIADLIAQAQAPNPKETIRLTVADELPNGTSGEQAEEAVEILAAGLAASKNNLNIIATHFPQRVTQKGYKNLKIEADCDEQGELIRPYKLEEGVSESKIAGKILAAALAKHKVTLPSTAPTATA